MVAKRIGFGAALLAAFPLLAQVTGPVGLAEPKAPKVAPVVEAPPPPLDPANVMNVELSSGGTVSILLRPDKAPLSTDRLKTLAGRHFYDGLVFHRVIDGFMAQGGDPKGDGSGGSDLPNLKAEFNDLPHLRGSLAMARAESPDSANSQFYIMLSPNLTLDRRYTVVGRVIAGMGNVDRIEKGEPPLRPTRMTRVYFGAAPADPTLPAAAPLPASVIPQTLPSGPITPPDTGPAARRTPARR